MRKAAAHTTTLHQEQRVTAAHLHTASLPDTAWRIGLPVAVMSVVGVVADNYFGSGPWLALLGLMVGFVVAGVLVKRQTPEQIDEK